jgi:flavin-dependent dehydrogenase
MYDAVVVGAGPAGSCLAGKLGGLNVLVIEKDKKVYPKDSGIVSSYFLNNFSRKFVKSGIKRMRLVSPSGNYFYLKSEKPYAFILRREKFLKSLRKGLDISYETVKKIEYRRNHAKVFTGENVYETGLVVGADGACSVVRKSAGIVNPAMVTGVMVRVNKIKYPEISVFFKKSFSPDFFSWIIPQNREYGLMSESPVVCLKNFRSRMRLPCGKIYSAPIPVGFTKSAAHRTMLIGDSAGQTKPLTGGGIIFGLRAASYAAEVIKSGRSPLDYERLWKKDFGPEIKRQLFIRNIYKKFTDRDIDQVFEKFGRHIENLGDFDYDHFTKSWKKLPKTRIIMFLMKRFLT